jgi:hypothetical protein
MICADESGWDRYTAAQWWNIRQWLDSQESAGADHDLLVALHEELRDGPRQYARYRRRYLGWGVFALRAR